MIFSLPNRHTANEIFICFCISPDCHRTSEAKIVISFFFAFRWLLLGLVSIRPITADYANPDLMVQSMHYATGT